MCRRSQVTQLITIKVFVAGKGKELCAPQYSTCSDVGLTGHTRLFVRPCLWVNLCVCVCTCLWACLSLSVHTCLWACLGLSVRACVSAWSCVCTCSQPGRDCTCLWACVLGRVCTCLWACWDVFGQHTRAP